MSGNTGATSSECPFVSVIVPVYNDPEGIRQCLAALATQTYPDSKLEVLVVDNGSTDETPRVIEESFATRLVEDEIQGSYAARNTGIEHATGDVLAFTDADSMPHPGWVEAGIETLQQENADMAAGRIVFEFTDAKTPAERYDASVNMRNDESVRDGVAKTGNLFVSRTVFDAVGRFPERLRSGGDVFWSRAATDRGFTLVYAHEAQVSHPSRQLVALLKKQYRVGKGQPQAWLLSGQSPVMVLLLGLFQFPLTVLSFVYDDATEDTGGSERGIPSDRAVERGFDVAIAGGFCLLAMTAGRIVGLATLAVNRLGVNP